MRPFFLLMPYVCNNYNAQVGSTLRSWTGVDADIGLLPKGDPPNPSTGAMRPLA